MCCCAPDSDSKCATGELFGPVAPELLGITFAVFDVHLGPKLMFQCPSDILSDAQVPQCSSEVVGSQESCALQFRAVKEFLIPKDALCNQLLVLRLPALGLHLLSVAVQILGRQYQRNALIFNVCFVLDASVVFSYRRNCSGLFT